MRCWLSWLFDRELTFEHIDQPLRWTVGQRALRLELDGHLCKRRSSLRCDVHNGEATGQPG